MCYKQSYKSKRIAKQSAHEIKKRGAIGPRDNLNPYYCNICQAWHLSRKSGDQWFNGLK